MNEVISKIEDALHELSQNPKGGWNEMLKGWKTPYYGYITKYLRKTKHIESDGVGLRWVGPTPTRTLAGLIYEAAKEASREASNKQIKVKSKSQIAHDAIYGTDNSVVPALVDVEPKKKDDLTRGLAVMEHAIKAGVVDPVAFARNILKDSRI